MNGDSLSSRIKKRRQELGLSLSNLASRINSSAATLSRYERGWDRFELYTLEKIATALNCQLMVDLKPITRKRIKEGKKKIIEKLQRLFWDHKLTSQDLARYPRWVIERVVEYGSLEDIHHLSCLMGRKEFLKSVAESRFQSEKTRTFWKQVLKREGVLCTKRSFQREVWIS